MKKQNNFGLFILILFIILSNNLKSQNQSLNSINSGVLSVNVGTFCFVGNLGQNFSGSSNYNFTIKQGTINPKNDYFILIPEKNHVLFPNPVKNSIIILSDVEKIEKIEIYDLIGNKIVEKIKIGFKIDIDISFVQNGTYFVKINSVDNSAVSEIIKIVVNK